MFIVRKNSAGLKSDALTVDARPPKKPCRSLSSQGVFIRPVAPCSAAAVVLVPQNWQNTWPSLISLPHWGQNMGPPSVLPPGRAGNRVNVAEGQRECQRERRRNRHGTAHSEG